MQTTDNDQSEESKSVLENKAPFTQLGLSQSYSGTKPSRNGGLLAALPSKRPEGQNPPLIEFHTIFGSFGNKYLNQLKDWNIAAFADRVRQKQMGEVSENEINQNRLLKLLLNQRNAKGADDEKATLNSKALHLYVALICYIASAAQAQLDPSQRENPTEHFNHRDFYKRLNLKKPKEELKKAQQAVETLLTYIAEDGLHWTFLEPEAAAYLFWPVALTRMAALGGNDATDEAIAQDALNRIEQLRKDLQQLKRRNPSQEEKYKFATRIAAETMVLLHTPFPGGKIKVVTLAQKTINNIAKGVLTTEPVPADLKKAEQYAKLLLNLSEIMIRAHQLYAGKITQSDSPANELHDLIESAKGLSFILPETVKKEIRSRLSAIDPHTRMANGSPLTEDEIAEDQKNDNPPTTYNPQAAATGAAPAPASHQQQPTLLTGQSPRQKLIQGINAYLAFVGSLSLCLLIFGRHGFSGKKRANKLLDTLSKGQGNLTVDEFAELNKTVRQSGNSLHSLSFFIELAMQSAKDRDGEDFNKKVEVHYSDPKSSVVKENEEGDAASDKNHNSRLEKQVADSKKRAGLHKYLKLNPVGGHKLSFLCTQRKKAVEERVEELSAAPAA